MFYRKGVGVFRRLAKGIQEWGGEAVGHLEAHTQQEREDEKHAHPRVFKQGESTQSKGVNKRLALHVLVDGAIRQSERINGQNDTLVAILEAREVHNPHGKDEADGTEHTDRGEGLHRVETGLVQGIVGYGVAQGDGRHEEGHADGIIREQLSETDRTTVFVAHVTRQGHENGGKEMADAQQLLCGNPAVSNDAHQGRHEKGNDALDGEEFADVGTHADTAEIDAQ